MERGCAETFERSVMLGRLKMCCYPSTWWHPTQHDWAMHPDGTQVRPTHCAKDWQALAQDSVRHGANLVTAQ